MISLWYLALRTRVNWSWRETWFNRYPVCLIWSWIFFPNWLFKKIIHTANKSNRLFQEFICQSIRCKTGLVSSIGLAAQSWTSWCPLEKWHQSSYHCIQWAPEVSLGEAPSPIMVFLKSATTNLSELTRKTLVSDLVAQHRIQNLDEQSFANPTTSPTLVPLPRLPSTPGRRYGLEQGCPNPLAGGFGHHTWTTNLHIRVYWRASQGLSKGRIKGSCPRPH